MSIPNRLDIEVDTRLYCKQFDVFFNGVKQRLCQVADVKAGFIIRFKLGIGRLPVRGRTGKYETEMIKGKVEIKPVEVKSVEGK